ncbi:MAG: hypothetical protein JSR82_24360 [Verrucomicrobia bacterium]|nr:hypothetical protein [Verrucomicrobiota bacterium]
MKRFALTFALVTASLLLNACASARAELVKPIDLRAKPAPGLAKGGGDPN